MENKTLNQKTVTIFAPLLILTGIDVLHVLIGFALVIIGGRGLMLIWNGSTADQS